MALYKDLFVQIEDECYSFCIYFHLNFIHIEMVTHDQTKTHLFVRFSAVIKFICIKIHKKKLFFLHLVKFVIATQNYQTYFDV